MQSSVQPAPVLNRRWLTVPVVLITTLLPASSRLVAQVINWHAIVDRHNTRQANPPAAHLSAAQRERIRLFLLHADPNPGACPQGDTSWTRKMSYSAVPLGQGKTTLVQVAAGCARGGQGSNGAMWIVDRTHAPAVLASLNGWFDGVQPTRTNGLHDFTVGWHMTCCEYTLSLYRFDKHQYQDVADVKVSCDEEDLCTIQPIGAVAAPTKLSAHP